LHYYFFHLRQKTNRFLQPFFFRKGNIYISQPLHRPMHIAIFYYRHQHYYPTREQLPQTHQNGLDMPRSTRTHRNIQLSLQQ
jgi:hypothetical protein